MVNFTGVQCVLAVHSLERSVAFYRDQLGFQVTREVEGWTFLARDAFRLMLGECPDIVPASQAGDHSYFAYVTVEDIDRFYATVLQNNVPCIQPLSNKPWGMREFGIRTPDGHRIMFGQLIEA